MLTDQGQDCWTGLRTANLHSRTAYMARLGRPAKQQQSSRMGQARGWTGLPRAGPGPGPPGCGLGRVRDSGGRAMPARGEKPGPGRCPRGDIAFSPDPAAAPREAAYFFIYFIFFYFFNFRAVRVMAPKWPGGLPKHGKTSKIIIFPQKGIKNMR